LQLLKSCLQTLHAEFTLWGIPARGKVVTTKQCIGLTGRTLERQGLLRKKNHGILLKMANSRIYGKFRALTSSAFRSHTNGYRSQGLILLVCQFPAVVSHA